MSIALYMDENVPLPITNGLRQRDVDVLRAQEDNHHIVSGCIGMI
jgi:hypothetical protein